MLMRTDSTSRAERPKAALQSRLALRFEHPVTIVSRERAKELFAKMRRDLGFPGAGKKK